MKTMQSWAGIHERTEPVLGLNVQYKVLNLSINPGLVLY